VLSVENGIAHGSARSVGGYHLLSALETCPDLFEQFGRHAAAAGVKIKSSNIDELRTRLNSHARSFISDEDLIPELVIDAHVSAQTLDLGLVRELSCLEPFGAGNPKPVLVTKDLILRDEPFVMKDKHLKMKLHDGRGRQFEAVWWDGVAKSIGQTLESGSRIELAYTAETNTWQGNTRLQLVVEDIRSEN
jgi:single-stranded-DNA-specific exonuclease